MTCTQHTKWSTKQTGASYAVPMARPEVTLPPSLTPAFRRLALGGIIGVGAFVTAWAVRGALADGYSPIDDAISRLAEIDRPGRGWMTAGFVAFGLGVPLYAQALRRAVDGPAWITTTVTGVATLAVAAAPLGRADSAHTAFALLGYVTLAATPLLAARTFRANGSIRWSRASVACGVGSSLVLAAPTIDAGHGLTQRLGLGITDGWIVATAWSMSRHGRIA